MPKIMLNYQLNGRRRLGRPVKRILDEAEAGLPSPIPDGLWWCLYLTFEQLYPDCSNYKEKGIVINNKIKEAKYLTNTEKTSKKNRGHSCIREEMGHIYIQSKQWQM